MALLLGPTALPAHANPILAPTVSFTADPAALDPDHPTATLSGQVTSATDQKPIAGLGVHLWIQYSQTTIGDVTTDATGHFTAPFSPTQQEIDPSYPNRVIVEASSASTSQYSSTTAEVFINLNRPQLSLTLTADRTKDDQGTPVGVTGKVQRQTASGWAPATGVTVDLANCGQSLGTVSTDGTGGFSTKVNMVCTDTIWGRAHGTLYQFADAYTPTITVRQQPVFSNMQASLDAQGQVAINGQATSSHATVSLDKQPLAIQYSIGDGTWRTVATTAFQTNDGTFATIFWTGRSGYYRVSFAGNADYAPAVSQAYKLWRWNTRFDRFSVSPGSVRTNHTVTVSGTLSRAVSMTKRTPYARQTVEIIFRFRGKPTWYHLAWAKTDAHGNFSKRVKAYGSGYYAVLFRGGPDTFATWTNGKTYVRTYSATGTPAALSQSTPLPPAVVTTKP